MQPLEEILVEVTQENTIESLRQQFYTACKQFLTTESDPAVPAEIADEAKVFFEAFESGQWQDLYHWDVHNLVIKQEFQIFWLLIAPVDLDLIEIFKKAKPPYRSLLQFYSCGTTWIEFAEFMQKQPLIQKITEAASAKIKAESLSQWTLNLFQDVFSQKPNSTLVLPDPREKVLRENQATLFALKKVFNYNHPQFDRFRQAFLTISQEPLLPLLNEDDHEGEDKKYIVTLETLKELYLACFHEILRIYAKYKLPVYLHRETLNSPPIQLSPEIIANLRIAHDENSMPSGLYFDNRPDKQVILKPAGTAKITQIQGIPLVASPGMLLSLLSASTLPKSIRQSIYAEPSFIAISEILGSITQAGMLWNSQLNVMGDDIVDYMFQRRISQNNVTLPETSGSTNGMESFYFWYLDYLSEQSHLAASESGVYSQISAIVLNVENGKGWTPEYAHKRLEAWDSSALVPMVSEEDRPGVGSHSGLGIDHLVGVQHNFTQGEYLLFFQEEDKVVQPLDNVYPTTSGAPKIHFCFEPQKTPIILGRKTVRTSASSTFEFPQSVLVSEHYEFSSADTLKISRNIAAGLAILPDCRLLQMLNEDILTGRMITTSLINARIEQSCVYTYEDIKICDNIADVEFSDFANALSPFGELKVMCNGIIAFLKLILHGIAAEPKLVGGYHIQLSDAPEDGTQIFGSPHQWMQLELSDRTVLINPSFYEANSKYIGYYAGNIKLNRVLRDLLEATSAINAAISNVLHASPANKLDSDYIYRPEHAAWQSQIGIAKLVGYLHQLRQTTDQYLLHNKFLVDLTEYRLQIQVNVFEILEAICEWQEKFKASELDTAELARMLAVLHQSLLPIVNLENS